MGVRVHDSDFSLLLSALCDPFLGSAGASRGAKGLGLSLCLLEV